MYEQKSKYNPDFKTHFFKSEHEEEMQGYRQPVYGAPTNLNQEWFRNDVKTLFSPKDKAQEIFPSQNRRIEDEVSETQKWEEIVQEEQRFPTKGNYITENVEMEKIHGFMKKFPRTKMYSELQTTFDNNAQKATEFLLQLIRSKGYNHHKPNLSKILEELLKNSDREDVPEMVQAMVAVTGKNPGDSDKALKYLDKADEVNKIIPQISIKYKPASRASFELEEIIHPEDDAEPRQIKSLNEPINTTDIMLPDDLFYQKVATKQLNTMQHYRKKHIPKKYAMLVDVSGSMDDGNGAKHSSITYACASAISLVRNAMQGMNEACVVPFDTVPKNPTWFKEPGQIEEYMLQMPFSGGGTNIDAALEKMDSMDVDECILITDGHDHVSYVPKTKLFTLFCGGGRNQSLEEISHSFDRVAFGVPDE